MSEDQKKMKNAFICRCFSIPASDIQKALDVGCTTLHQILDFTGAGCGPCGGTCRVKINQMLENYLKHKNQ
jgi:bacterioferritin-associated ferredoxin